MAEGGAGPAEEAASTTARLFDLFYTRFLLRDVVGKVVPGTIFLILVLLSSKNLDWLIDHSKNLTNPQIAFIVAITWLIALSLQGINSRLVSFYFPITTNLRSKNRSKSRILNDNFIANTEEINAFLRIATSDEKAQYERFVVIKEACGNAFFCMLWGGAFLVGKTSLDIAFRQTNWQAATEAIRSNLGDALSYGCLFAGILISMYKMHKDHVYRQSRYAQIVIDADRKRTLAGVLGKDKQSMNFAYFADEAINRIFQDCDVVVFDMNGLMIDDEQIQLDSTNCAISALGVQISEAEWINECVGHKPSEYLGYFIDKSEKFDDPADMPLVDDIIREKDEIYRKSIVADIKKIVRPGISELMVYLNKADIRMAVATSTTTEGVEIILGLAGLNLKSQMQCIVCGDDVKKAKPDPEIYRAVMNSLGDNLRYVAIEDARPGVLSAKAANMKCVAVPNKFTVAQDLSDADIKLDSLLPSAQPIRA